VFGFYRHKKGGLYFILGTFKHTEFENKYYVGYIGRSGWWVRPKIMFTDGRFEKVSLWQVLFGK
jgi:hypothetical protein